jgi:hypothetical protein
LYDEMLARAEQQRCRSAVDIAFEHGPDVIDAIAPHHEVRRGDRLGRPGWRRWLTRRRKRTAWLKHLGA